jgi:hypothetical protein
MPLADGRRVGRQPALAAGDRPAACREPRHGAPMSPLLPAELFRHESAWAWPTKVEM